VDNIKPVILAESTVPCWVGSTQFSTIGAKPNLDPSSMSRHHDRFFTQGIPESSWRRTTTSNENRTEFFDI